MNAKPPEPMTTRRALLLANWALLAMAEPGPRCELRKAAAKLKEIQKQAIEEKNNNGLARI